jgi:hypothetical protein
MSWLDGSAACPSAVPCSSTGSSLVVSGLTVAGAGAVVVPVPTPVSATTCGLSGCTINANWVEFTPYASFTGTPPSTASVLCSTSSPTFTVSCTWAYGVKYQCNPGATACYTPIPIFEGVHCPYPTPQALETDQTASDGITLSTAAIAGIAAGCVVVVVGLLVVIVILVKRKPTEEYV